MAHPSKCDNYYAISAQLAAQRDHEEIALLTSEGSSYLFMLAATNFLGRKSPVRLMLTLILTLTLSLTLTLTLSLS